MTENALKPYVIGLDLGGTNSVFGIVDARGEIKATTAIKTGGYDNVNDYVKAAVEALQPIIETVGGIEKIKAMGSEHLMATSIRDYRVRSQPALGSHLCSSFGRSLQQGSWRTPSSAYQ